MPCRSAAFELRYKLKVQGVAVHVGRAAPWRLEDHSRISRSSPVRAPLEQVKIEGEASVMLQPKLQWAMQTSLWAWRYSESIKGVRGNPNRPNSTRRSRIVA